MRIHRRTSVLLLLAGTLLGGCASVDSPRPPDSGLPDQLSFQADAGQALTEVPVHWWESFHDAELNQLVSAGLEQNYSLQAAWARLARSRAVWRQTGADKYPDLNLSLSKSRKWREDVTADLWSAGLSTEYELDFWGRISALDEQSRLTALASEAAVRTQANTVAGQIALNWYGLLMQQENLQLLQTQQQRLEAALQVVRGRFQRGQVAISDVWQQEQLLESVNTSIISARADYAAYQQQLALWSGNSAWFALDQAGPALRGQSLPALGEAVTQVDLQAVALRPDVEQAWLSVQAANAGLAAAVANRYPRFTLSASYSGEDEDLGQVMDNWVGNLAGALVFPLIDGGNRRAVVAQNKAAVEEQLASYQQTLLDAAQEVQQALITEQQSADSLLSIGRRLELARQTESFQNNRYRKGVGDFLSLLNAQQDVISLEQQVLSARWSRIQNRIQLFRAVSHGNFLRKEASA